MALYGSDQSKYQDRTGSWETTKAVGGYCSVAGGEVKEQSQAKEVVNTEHYGNRYGFGPKASSVSDTQVDNNNWQTNPPVVKQMTEKDIEKSKESFKGILFFY